MSNAIVKYNTSSGEEINLTPNRVRELILTGSGKVSDREVINFMLLCRANKLNPFTREVYMIKFGSEPATIVTAKTVFVKRAMANSRFRGMQSGITVLNKDGVIERREGSLVLTDEELIGGWCRVFIDKYLEPLFDEVSMTEYDKGQSSWKKIPATMIRKVAIVHALREAFPEDLGGLYESAEMGTQEIKEQPVYDDVTITEEEELVIEPDEVIEEADKDLQAELGMKMKQAVSLGIKASGIKSRIKSELGREITELNNYELDKAIKIVELIIKDKETIDKENESGKEPEYYEEDIPF